MSGCIGRRGPKPTKNASVKKPAKAKVKKPSKGELLEEKARLYDRIRTKEKERRKLLSRFDELTKERKAAKEALGFCSTEICGLGHAMDEKHPLFDQAADEKAETKPAENAAPAESKPAGKDAWKALPLAGLKLPARIEKAIDDAGLSTLGALSAFMGQHGEFWAKDIKGMGEKGRDDVCDAFVAFWKAHPEYCEEKQPEAA